MIADPEARSVATKTFNELLILREKATKMEKEKEFRKSSVIMNKLMDKYKIDLKLDETNQNAHNVQNIQNNVYEYTIKYISEITASLIKTKTIDKNEYEEEIMPYLKHIGLESNVLDFLYEEAQNVISFSGDIVEEDDGELLCDCEFTLAYGTKILLHNTKLRLKKGYKYGLLGQNDSGKTTLMRAIAEGSVDGFPDADEVKTVFVEADIQGELSHLNCVDYVLEFDKIKEMGATKEMVRDVLKKVGFTEGKSAGAGGDCDDPIASLSGGWRMKLA